MAVAQQGDGNIYVHMEVEISSVNIGRMIFKLYNDSCPKTVENFRSLCTGERGTGLTTKRPLHYAGAKFHRIIPGFMCQGGDFELGDGRGGESVYGGKFNDEPGGLAIKHTKRGLLSMANCGPDTNGSQFFILFKAAAHLNGKHCVFGEMVDGDATLDAIEGVKTQSDDKPIAPILVARCGQMERRVIGMRRVAKKRKKQEGGDDASGSSSSSSSDKKKKKKKDKKKKKKKKDKASVELITIKFRNYVPLNEDLANSEMVKDLIGRATAIEEQMLKELQESVFKKSDLVNITARRPNWDLKRDIERKMQRLYRNTMKSIRAVVAEKKARDEAESSSSSSSGSDSDGSSSDSDD